MNGRVYDPALGRFMSADPYIQAPDNIQSYNRYAYVFNSPLTLADPSGYFSLGGIFRSVRNAVSDVWQTVKDLKQPIATIGCTVATNGAAGPCAALVTKISGGSWNQALKAGLVADATQSAFYMVGTYFPGAGQAGLVTPASVFQNTVGHAAVGCASAMLSGDDCGSGALSAGIAAAFGNYNNGGDITQSGFSKDPYIAVFQNAVIGGTGAALGGGKFGNGAVTASFGYLFNQLAHRYQVGRTWMCDMDQSGCTMRAALEVVDKRSLGGLEILNGSPVEGNNILAPFNDPIEHIVDRENFKIYNITLEGHQFYPGQVEHSLSMDVRSRWSWSQFSMQQVDAIYLTTVGTGSGPNLNWNNFVGKSIFWFTHSWSQRDIEKSSRKGTP